MVFGWLYGNNALKDNGVHIWDEWETDRRPWPHLWIPMEKLG
ncbi:MAG: hypothetical protein Ct9H90mP13_00480 [Pseudomonadota bacterium]|nr:MAG: hypothetical protein Ct9H90mP13_00480 [Pseudomonadota bacterium]